ncbi:MAG: hypothetical protein KIS88_03615 [Anaerolineales bacterium]|nr:hypothetical protein [Anaerolineales bacterium]
MVYRPKIKDSLLIDGEKFTIQEHPTAQGMPYGQTGRRATVYQIRSTTSRELKALKVFTLAFRRQWTATELKILNTLAKTPGLQAAQRMMLAPSSHAELLKKEPDLIYAQVMPWVNGKTWQEIILTREPLNSKESLELAKGLAGLLAKLETRGMAHCDLSGPNVMVQRGNQVALVDLEEVYAEGLGEPKRKPAGSEGYAHLSVSKGVWSPEADRFASAVLLGEMLCWCDAAVREAAYGEQYFSPKDMQIEGKRFSLMHRTLQEKWGDEIAGLFEKAWKSKTLRGCPTAEEWQKALIISEKEQTERSLNQVETLMQAGKLHEVVALAEEIYAFAPLRGNLPLTRALMKLAAEEEKQGRASAARAHYERAYKIHPTGNVGYELAKNVRRLQSETKSPVKKAKQPSRPARKYAKRTERPVEDEPRPGMDQSIWLWAGVLVLILFWLYLISNPGRQPSVPAPAPAATVAQPMPTRTAAPTSTRIPSTATPSPQARQSPQLAQAEQWPFVLYDDFASNNNHWILGELGYSDSDWRATGGLSNQALYWQVTQSSPSGVYFRDYPWPQDELETFYFYVWAWQEYGQPETACYGISFRENEAGYYLLAVCQDSSYQVFALVGDTWETIKPWTYTADIYNTQPNQIGVLAYGSQYHIVINHTVVYTFRDTRLQSGITSLVMWASAPNDTPTYYFWDLVIQSP